MQSCKECQCPSCRALRWLMHEASAAVLRFCTAAATSPMRCLKALCPHRPQHPSELLKFRRFATSACKYQEHETVCESNVGVRTWRAQMPTDSSLRKGPEPQTYLRNISALLEVKCPLEPPHWRSALAVPPGRGAALPWQNKNLASVGLRRRKLSQGTLGKNAMPSKAVVAWVPTSAKFPQARPVTPNPANSKF